MGAEAVRELLDAFDAGIAALLDGEPARQMTHVLSEAKNDPACPAGEWVS